MLTVSGFEGHFYRAKLARFASSMSGMRDALTTDQFPEFHMLKEVSISDITTLVIGFEDGRAISNLGTHLEEPKHLVFAF